MRSVATKLWEASPAKVARMFRFLLREWRQRPGWFEIQGGPAAGAQLFLPNSNEGAWREIVTGSFDSFFYAALKDYRDLKGTLCWDVGANIGYHSLGFAAQGARVLAFEPNHAMAQRLRVHLEKNTTLAKKIRLLPLALSDRDGEVSFLHRDELDGASSSSHLADAVPPLPCRRRITTILNGLSCLQPEPTRSLLVGNRRRM
jgi:hypothetical protein